MISVIIPMYNSSGTIIRALESVRRQTMIDKVLEIIIINDGSTDDSLETVERYSNLYSYLPINILNKTNEGVSSARNAGLRIAKGEWIALLDSDDEWLPKKLKIQIETIKKNPSIDFIGGNADSKELHILWRKVDKLYKANIRDLCIKCFPPTPTAFFRRKIVDDIGLFDETQRFGEDMNYFNKICLDYNYYHLPVQLVILNGGVTRKSHTGLSSNLKEMHKGNIKNINELRKNKKIDFLFYIFLRVFYWIKYLRRIILWRL